MDIGKVIQLPKNSDFILFNTVYNNRVNEDGVDDALSLIFKNMKTGEKFIKTIDNPQIEIYVANPDVDLGNYDHIDIKVKDTHIEDASYKNILKDMAKLIGREDYFWQCIRERRFDDLKRIQEVNRFFSSDRNIEDFYRYKCLKHFGEKMLNNTTKGFLDIEADIKKGNINFKEGRGSAPINAITFIDGHNMECYTVCLRDKDNPLIQELEDDLDGFIDELHDSYDDLYGKFNYNIAFFDSEVELIKVTFQIINTLKLDFVMVWNMSFDIPYMINRLEENGVDPIEVMCHKDFRYPVCKFNKDKKNFKIKKKTDNFKVSSYTCFMDQMINYAAIRKSQSELPSYKLDDIGEREVKAKKLDYSEVGSLRELPYVNYRKFIKYNINDVLLQFKIEQKTGDVDDIFYRSYSSNTRYDKIFKEITFLTNVAFKEFETYGIILGNNTNAIRYNRFADQNMLVDESEDEEISSGNKKKKFKGAIVGDPILILPVGIPIIGKRKSRSLFYFVIDYDYTSLYPTILKLFNIYKSTLLGKIELSGKPTEKEARVSGEVGYNRGAKLMEDLETREYSFIGERWFGLPGMEELIDIVGSKLDDKQKYKVVKISRKIKENKNRKVKIKRVG